jgi:RNA polymerase sigma-70 factor (ECF subfamily)
MVSRTDNQRQDQRDAAPGQEGRSDSETLLAVLIERYSDLKQRLARRLGSADWAEDALQDTYLRINGMEVVGRIRNPTAYVIRAAFNIALNQRRTENRRLGAPEIEALLHIADDAPDALRIIEGRADIVRLKEVMAELPPRAREILLAARLDVLSRQQIAQRFGISVSMVEKELKWAQEYCADRFRSGRGKS